VFPRQRAPNRIDNLVAGDRFGIAAPDFMYCNEIHPLGFVSAPSNGPAIENASSAISTLLPRSSDKTASQPSLSPPCELVVAKALADGGELTRAGAVAEQNGHMLNILVFGKKRFAGAGPEQMSPGCRLTSP
jgi:hypothetical protein